MKREVSAPLLIGVVVLALAVAGFLYWRSFGPTGYGQDKPGTRMPMDKLGDPRKGNNPMFKGAAPSTQTPGAGEGR